MNNSICAVIVTYEPNISLVRLYNSIRNQVEDIVIVDNNTSSYNSIQILKSIENNNINIIYNKQNSGVASALNQGVNYAINKKYKWILTLDQDSEFLPNTYELLLSYYEQLKDKRNVMIVAPNVIERINLKDKNINCFNNKQIEWKNVICNLTSGSLIKAEIFNKVGFFDEKLFIEQVDNDFCYRLIKNKYNIKIATNIYFIQEIGTAIKKCGCIVRNHNYIRKFYLSRNVTFMLKRYFFVAPYTTMRYFLGGTIFSWIKTLLFEKNKIVKIFNGVKGFYCGLFNIYGKNK